MPGSGDPSLGGSPPPHPLAGTAPAAVLAAEDAIRPLRQEVAIWFDRQSNELGRRTGGITEVTFEAADVASMRDAIFTHNHPDGWNYPAADPRRAGNSLSDDDVALAIRAKVAELRVVTPTRRYSIRRPLHGWSADASLVRLYHAAYRQVVLAELELAYEFDRVTLEEKDASLYDETVRRLADQLGIAHTRWEG